MTNLAKNPKTPIWANMNFPGKKAPSVFKYSNYPPLYQKSEKINYAIPEEMLNWQTEG